MKKIWSFLALVGLTVSATAQQVGPVGGPYAPLVSPSITGLTTLTTTDGAFVLKMKGATNLARLSPGASDFSITATNLSEAAFVPLTLGGSVVALSPSTGVLTISSLTQTSAAQSGTMCYNSGTSAVTYDATLGCLSSLEEYKNISANIFPPEALSKVLALKPFWFSYKSGFGFTDLKEHAGFGAHQVEKIDQRLVGYGANGKLAGVRYAEMTAVLVAAIQAQEIKIRELETKIKKNK